MTDGGTEGVYSRHIRCRLMMMARIVRLREGLEALAVGSSFRCVDEFEFGVTEERRRREVSGLGWKSVRRWSDGGVGG